MPDANAKSKSAAVGGAAPRQEGEQVTFRLSPDLATLLDEMAVSKGLSRHVLAREIVLKHLEPVPNEVSLDSILYATQRTEALLLELSQLLNRSQVPEGAEVDSPSAAILDKVATLHGDLVEAVGVISSNQKFLSERLNEKHDVLTEHIGRLTEDISTTLMLLLVRDRPLTIDVARKLVLEKLHNR